ncbi:MAG TPA: hypothetical protein VHC94_05140 [Nitrobacter sp.]|nr:hypothetical protein [Nitrobacter sp.]
MTPRRQRPLPPHHPHMIPVSRTAYGCPRDAVIESPEVRLPMVGVSPELAARLERIRYTDAGA